MKNHITVRFTANLLNRALLALFMIGLLTSQLNSQTPTSRSEPKKRNPETSGGVMKSHMTFQFRVMHMFLALLLIGVFTSDGNSQTTDLLTLRLNVVDAQGTVVSGAKVVLNTEGTDKEITGVTNEGGTVTFANLPAGTTKVTVTATGFATLEERVTVSLNQRNDFTLSVGPPRFLSAVKQPTGALQVGSKYASKCGGASPCPVSKKIDSLWTPPLKRFARGLQYEYKLVEQPRTILVTSGAEPQFQENPQDNLQQHTLTFKFAELFPDRLSMFKRASDYLKKYPQAADRQPSEILCGDKPLITCLAKNGRWWERVLMGISVNVSASQRADFQQGFIVTGPEFGKKYQFNAGGVFDPAKLIPSATTWKSAFDDVQKIDKALALLQVGDVLIKKRPWAHWSVALIPKVEFKRLSQFDFVTDNGVLVQAPFPNQGLNTWTFTWDVARLILDTNNRLDSDAIDEALDSLQKTIGVDEKPWKKQCVIQIPGEPAARDIKDLHPAFQAESCQLLAQRMNATTYQLSCVKDGVPRDDGAAVSPMHLPQRPAGNQCNW